MGQKMNQITASALDKVAFIQINLKSEITKYNQKALELFKYEEDVFKNLSFEKILFDQKVKNISTEISATNFLD